MIITDATMTSVRIVSASTTETEVIGRAIGIFLKGQKGGRTVLLYGDLGAGKTALTRGIATALGIPGSDVSSPSFIIVSEHDGDPPFYHIDLYRVRGRDDIEALGLWEYLHTEGITVIEWAERLSEIPEDSVRVTLAYIDEHSREVRIEGMPGGFFVERFPRAETGQRI